MLELADPWEAFIINPSLGVIPIAVHLFNQLSCITSILVVTPADVPIKVGPFDLYNLKVQFPSPFIAVFLPSHSILSGKDVVLRGYIILDISISSCSDEKAEIKGSDMFVTVEIHISFVN